jgi:hypothetical protein
MSEKPIPWIGSRKDYQRLRRMIGQHPDMPDTFEEWHYLTNKKIAEEEGGSVQKVNVDPDEFHQFCIRTNAEPDVTSLRTFVEQKAKIKRSSTP